VVLAVMGDEWMPTSLRRTDEDRAKIGGPRLHNV
jgi:hypothetical protein